MNALKITLTTLSIAVLLSSPSALAQVNGDWNFNGSDVWSNTARWNSSPVASVPGGDGSIVNLTFNVSSNRTVTIDTTSRTVGQLTIGDPDGTHRYDLAASGGAGLIFQNLGNAAKLNYTSNAVLGAISAPISLAANLEIANNSANQQTISSTISSSTAGLKTIQIGGSASGLLNFTGIISDGTGQVGMTINNTSGGGVFLGSTSNSFSGSVNLQAGRMVLTQSSVNGTGVLNITGGSIESNGGNTRRISGNVTLDGTVTLGNATNSGLVFFENAASTINLLNNSTISTASSARIDHIITGTSGFTKTGSDSLQLYGVHTYSGVTNIAVGTLILQTGSINASSQAKVSSSATLTNNSSTNFTTALVIEEAAILDGTGTFAPISMTLQADFTGGDAAFSSIATGSTSLAKSGNMEFTLINVTNGNYTILTGTAISGAFTTMTVGGFALGSLGSGNFQGTVGGFDYTFTNSTNLLTVVPEPSSLLLLTIWGIFVVVTRRRIARLG